ncbi:MAG: ATP-binding protein [Planctomycetes bacterium]|nr:ATP-binding protein [Planctomycetota bacterium]
MTKNMIRPWLEVVELHPDVLAENFSEDIFALDLGPLADGNPRVPAVYRDAEQFFRASYLTTGIRSLLQDVLSRLSGGEGNRILKLVTPFGGGKSHTLASLHHAAKNRKVLDAIPEAKGLPHVAEVRTAVFDGQFFDPTNGKEIPDTKIRAKTVWGWIAWSLGGAKGYEMLHAQDEARVAPGADEILKLLGDKPNLILLDETLQYLISCGGLRVHDTTLRDETLTFLKNLTVAISNSGRSVLVFSLQSSKRESLEYSSLLSTVDHFAARKDQRREPVEGDEILRVIQRRLLKKLPDESEAIPAASAFQDTITQMRRADAQTDAERSQADEDGLALRNRIRAAYPFHPALIELMRERWAAIPDFQRTRGALRFLAACLRAVHKEEKSRALLGPGDVPIHNQEVRLAFFKEVGQKEDFQACLEHDFTGANSRVRKIDERRAKEVSSEAGKRPATRLATAILMYSFGGRRRQGGTGEEMLPPGISEEELLQVCVGPDLDRTTAQACLKELREKCLYLHFDGVRYCFKKDPNVTLLVEQEADAVARDERGVRKRVRDLLEARLAGHRSTIVWPEQAQDIDDKDPSFLVAYLPLEFVANTRAAQELAAKELFSKHGDQPRRYRNGLALAIPSSDQSEALRRSVRYLMAIEHIEEKARQHNLTDEQRSQLRERRNTEKAAIESAFLRVYSEVWLPRVVGGQIAIEPVTVGGRPLQATLSPQKEAAVQERIMELLVSVNRKVFGSLAPVKIVELFKIGEGTPPRISVKVSEVVDGFFSFLGWTRLLSGDVIRSAIVKGVSDGTIAYFTGPDPGVGPDGKLQIPTQRVRNRTMISPDEIDLEAGVICDPRAVLVEAPPAEPPIGAGFVGADKPIESPSPQPAVGTSAATTEKHVEITFSADRNQLFKVWEAVANLADLAGRVSVTLRAESEKGLDKSKLRNGVIEPLREADLIE